MANLSGQPDVMGGQTRRAAWGAALMLAAAAVYTLFSFWLTGQTPGWQLAAQTGVMAAYCVAVAAGWWLAGRGRLALAGWLINGALWVTTTALAFLIQDLGWVMATIAVVLTAAVTALMLSGPAVTRAIVLSLGVGSLILLADLFGWQLWPRQTIPALQVAAPVIAGALALAYVGLIARQFPRYALRTKLLIGFVTVVALAVVALAAVTGYVIRTELSRQAGLQVAVLAAARAAEVAAALERQIDAVRVISLNKFVQDSLAAASQTAPEAAQRQALDEQWRAAGDADALITGVVQNELAVELREFQRTFPNHVEVFVTDRAGAVVAADARPTDYDQSDEVWWQTALRAGLYLGQPEYDASSRTIGLVVALPVPAHDQTGLVGVVRTTLSLEVFSGPLLSGQFGETGDTEVYLPSGLMLDAAPGGERRVWVTPATFDRRGLVLAAPAYQETTAQGVVSLVSNGPIRAEADAPAEIAQAINELGWFTVAHQSRAEALQVAEAATRATLFTAFASLIAAGLAALFLSQQLTRPLMGLTAVAAQVSGGDLTVQAPVETEDEIGALATTFNVMTTQLRETLESLERRVAARTRALTASADVSRRLAVIADEPTLVQTVVDEIQKAFGFYHAHIYLWDAGHENLIMAGGTGEAGQTMLARGHRLTRGRGLVGQAAETGAAVVVADTAQSPVWVANPLLPETRSEAAVPITLGAEGLGVLDVQHNQVGGFSAEDVELLQSLANQVAVALQNARAAAATQAAAARAAQIAAINQQILGAATVDDALRVAVREVGRALGGARARVALAPAPDPQRPA